MYVYMCVCVSSIPSSVRKATNDVSGGEYKISVNDFLVKAAAVALRKIPEVNSSWTDTAIRRWAGCRGGAIDTVQYIMILHFMYF